MNKKDRRHSGRVTPQTTAEMPYKEIIAQGLEPQEFWDDWVDYRDGMRGRNDKTRILRKPRCYYDMTKVLKYNKKNKLMIKRRKARKREEYFWFNISSTIHPIS